MRTLIEHIMCPDNQVKSCVHTSRKDFKEEFSGACTYLASEHARIFPEKDPGYQRYRTYGRDTENKCDNKKLIYASASGRRQHNKVMKENGSGISNTSRYFSPD